MNYNYINLGVHYEKRSFVQVRKNNTLLELLNEFCVDENCGKNLLTILRTTTNNIRMLSVETEKTMASSIRRDFVSSWMSPSFALIQTRSWVCGSPVSQSWFIEAAEVVAFITLEAACDRRY
ncbi:Uncharacterized protein Fot_28949 [Forsythia ovata]|uniref:Uncharacterized protein n=1 Tax=Forsythia ovata TaxID=205694 RepID=A0ABD1TQG9_9LAMI